MVSRVMLIKMCLGLVWKFGEILPYSSNELLNTDICFPCQFSLPQGGSASSVSELWFMCTPVWSVGQLCLYTL